MSTSLCHSHLRIETLHHLAWSRYRLAPGEALETAEQALREPQIWQDPLLLAENRAIASQARIQLNELETAEALTAEALALIEGSGSHPICAQVLYTMGVWLTHRARYEEAEEYLLRALPMARHHSLLCLEVDCLNDLAQTHHCRSNFARTLEIVQESYPLAQKAQYRLGEQIALTRLGNVYDRLGDYPAALEAHLGSIRIAEEIGDTHGIIVCQNNIGNVHLQLMDHQAGLRAYHSGLELARTREEPWLEGLLLGNIGLAYYLIEDLDCAVAYHRESLTIKQGTGDLPGEANTIGNLGATLLKRGDLKEAETCLSRAIELYREIGDQHGEVHNLIHLGKLLARQAAVSPATPGVASLEFASVLERALDLAEHIGSPELVNAAQEGLSEAWKAVGDYQKALCHFERFHAGKERLFTEKMTQRTRDLKALHEIEQTRLEAELQRLRTIELAKALQEAEQQRRLAEHLAREDSLTGLLTRRFGEMRLAEEFQRAQVSDCPLSVALLDVDHFKRINDTFSHPLGDAVLRQVARLFQENCRPQDTVARYGGEEFLLLLPETNASLALSLCERLRQAVEKYDWSGLQRGLAVTVSIGLCESVGQVHPEKVISVADARLYEAKRRGRNQIVS